jgi:hypothetical protein
VTLDATSQFRLLLLRHSNFTSPWGESVSVCLLCASLHYSQAEFNKYSRLCRIFSFAAHSTVVHVHRRQEDDGITISECEKYAPYVAGLNTAACDVYAGDSV